MRGNLKYQFCDEEAVSHLWSSFPYLGLCMLACFGITRAVRARRGETAE